MFSAAAQVSIALVALRASFRSYISYPSYLYNYSRQVPIHIFQNGKLKITNRAIHFVAASSKSPNRGPLHKVVALRQQ